MNIKEKVYGYKTKHKQGFVQLEINELLKDFPGINMEKFNDALRGNTCMVIKGEIIQYHCDIEKALYCGVENRNLRLSEWD
jgi:hypothetical protein